MHWRALLVVLVAGCGGESARDDTAQTGSAAPAPVVGGSAVAGDTGKAQCPPTGLWSQCAVVERLDRAGLAPRLDSTATPREDPLTPAGFLVRVGSSELEVYVYPSVAARRSDVARIDTTRYLGYTEAVSIQQLPTIIQSANLIAILHSRTDHQRERVGDALTAGPPQPSQPSTLPPASPQGTSSP